MGHFCMACLASDGAAAEAEGSDLSGIIAVTWKHQKEGKVGAVVDAMEAPAGWLSAAIGDGVCIEENSLLLWIPSF